MDKTLRNNTLSNSGSNPLPFSILRCYLFKRVCACETTNIIVSSTHCTYTYTIFKRAYSLISSNIVRVVKKFRRFLKRVDSTLITETSDLSLVIQLLSQCWFAACIAFTTCLVLKVATLFTTDQTAVAVFMVFKICENLSLNNRYCKCQSRTITSRFPK